MVLGSWVRRKARVPKCLPLLLGEEWRGGEGLTPDPTAAWC